MIKKAREEKKAADEAKASAERSASPAESAPKTEEIVDGENVHGVMIDTRSEEKKRAEAESDEDAPPELEKVDAEKLREEQAHLD